MASREKSEVPYTQGHDASVHRSHSSRKAADSCAYFLHLLKPDFHVLDAGCGPGSITTSIAAFVPDGRVVGVDNAEGALAKAKSQCDIPKNVEFKTASMLSLPFDDNIFNVVYTSQSLVHIPDVSTAFKELRRVCKPGGFVACREADAWATYIWPEHPGLTHWHLTLAKTPETTKTHPKGARQLLRWALDAGFPADNIQYTHGSITYSGQGRKFWGETMANRVMHDDVWREKAKSAGLATDEDFVVMRDGWKVWMEDEGAVFTAPCGQVVCHK